MSRSSKYFLTILTIIFIAALMLRLGSPDSLDRHDQAKQALYVLDIYNNHNFIIQYERGDIIATKPPLYNWIAFIGCFIAGDVNEFLVRLPAILSTIGLIIITVLFGRKLHSLEAGLLGGIFLASNVHFVNLSAMARPDMLLTFLMIIGLYYFYLGLENNNRWHYILGWSFLAISCLTKGPFGAIGIVIVFLIYLCRTKSLSKFKKSKWLFGILAIIFVMAGWALLAYYLEGDKFYKTAMDETVNRVGGVGTRAQKTRPFYYFIPLLFGRFAPWSIFLIPAFIVLRKDKRALLPMIWTITLLVYFSLSKGKRQDYIFPLYPGASLLIAMMFLELGKLYPEKWPKLVKGFAFFAASLLIIVGLVLILITIHPPLKTLILDKFVKDLVKRNSMKAISSSLLDMSGFVIFIGAITSFIGTLKNRHILLWKGLLLCNIAVLSLYFFIFSDSALFKFKKHQLQLVSFAQRHNIDTTKINFVNCENRALSFYLKNNLCPVEDTNDKLFLVLKDENIVLNENENKYIYMNPKTKTNKKGTVLFFSGPIEDDGDQIVIFKSDD